MKPVRVLYVRNFRGITDITGAETYLFSLLQGLDRNRYEPLLVCITNTAQPEQQWLTELKRRKLPFVIVPIKHRASIHDLIEVRKLILRFGADVVHSLDHRADIVAMAGARLTGKAALASFFGWSNWDESCRKGRLYAWLDRKFLKRADAIIVDSAHIATHMQWPQGEGAPLAVIPNGVDTRRFDPDRITDTLKEKFFGDRNAIVLGMVGRVHPNKGQLDFIQAAASLAAGQPQLRFLIIGDAPIGFEDYYQKVSDRITTLGLQDRALITNVPSAQIPVVMNSIDVLLAPSYQESFSYTLLEAMAMEKPVIASNAGGTPEMVSDGENGLLVPPGDPQALVQAADRLLSDTSLCSRMGKRARQIIMKDWSIEIMADRTMRVYEEVLSCRGQKNSDHISRQLLRKRLATISNP
ncbi:MAG TPA: glycosyltransferase family 1 protein [Gammaproteobacteria bacterium]|nr:glycosyltransferase family 1 protein [Gammaproteobacteria bacterium]